MLLITASLFILIVFVNRYVFGSLLKRIRGRQFELVNAAYEPTVTVIIPMYNEGQGIYRTIKSILDQDYPREKLNVFVVDDCSTDNSLEWARRAASEWPSRVRVLVNPLNVGKRIGIMHAVRKTNAVIVVSVDSDVVLDKKAIRVLVSRFADKKMAAVGGRVRVYNASENWLTRLQAIKYYYGYELFKNLERAFCSVLCLSGCLTAYRREVLIEMEPALADRAILGVPIKYGEDRYLTRQIVKAGYKTFLTLEAVCWTVVPNTFSKFWSQQLRWRRSVIIDFIGAISHAWRLHPFVTLHFTAVFAMEVSYPLVLALGLITGNMFALAAFHVAILSVLAVWYSIDTRKWPARERVHPVWFLFMAVVMPPVYLLLTPLALLTLDSSSWETRGHGMPPPRMPRPSTGATAAILAHSHVRSSCSQA